MNLAISDSVSPESTLFPKNWIDSVNRNRPNLLQFLSNANASLNEPEASGNNIPRKCNDLYDVIQSATGDARTAAEHTLASVYKQNSTLANGSQLSDEYINVLMDLNFSTNPLLLQSLIGIVGDAIFEPVYLSGFADNNGINLLSSLINISNESDHKWVLNLTFTLNADPAFKTSVNSAIASNNRQALTQLLNTVEWDGVGSVDGHQLYINNLVAGLFSAGQTCLDKAKRSSLTFQIGEIAYVELW